MNNINSVQSFIRFMAFIVSMVVFAIIFIPLISIISFGSSESTGFLIFLFGGLALWISAILSRMFFVLPEWDRLVLLRIGKFAGVRGPGYFVIPPFIYSVAAIIDTRIVTQQVEATATLTKDNVPTKATAAIEFEVEDPQKAVLNVKNYLNSIIWLSTEALKNTIGGLDLKEFLSNREKIARQLKQQIDVEAANYGVNVRAVRITDIDTPTELVEELAVIARARRAAEAKQIQASAEVMVAKKIAEASALLANQKGGFRLREIQNLSAMSKEESSMIIIYPVESGMGESLASASIAMAKKRKI